MPPSACNKLAVSILIPVYNQKVIALVTSLAEQLDAVALAGEIRIWEDGSDEKAALQNDVLKANHRVQLHRSPVNEGRLTARQKLAGMARYDYLLFLDADSAIIRPDFMEQYARRMQEGAALVTGGRVYTDQAPDCAFRLHWTYGRKRENRAGAAFMSNNFLVRKDLFLQLEHSTPLPRYGHEDTWWGLQFRQQGITPLAIDNPVLHAQLDTAPVFLQKSLDALDNLIWLETKTSPSTLSSEVKIYRWYRRMRKMGMLPIFCRIEKWFDRHFRTNLLSCAPRLFYFDMVRLAELARRKKNQSNK